MYKKGLLIFFVVFLFVFSPSITLAGEINLPNVSITPDNYLFYSFKRLSEKAIVLTKFSSRSKADYYSELSAIRLAELKNAVDKKYLNDIQQSSQRLSSQIGILADLISANKADLGKDMSKTKELFSNYKNILANLRDQFPANSSFWMLVQHSINSIDLNLDKLK